MSFKKVYRITATHVVSPRQGNNGSGEGTKDIQRNKGRDLFPNPQGDLLLSWHILQTTCHFIFSPLSRGTAFVLVTITFLQYLPTPEHAISQDNYRNLTAETDAKAQKKKW